MERRARETYLSALQKKVERHACPSFWSAGAGLADAQMIDVVCVVTLQK